MDASPSLVDPSFAEPNPCSVEAKPSLDDTAWPTPLRTWSSQPPNLVEPDPNLVELNPNLVEAKPHPVEPDTLVGAATHRPHPKTKGEEHCRVEGRTHTEGASKRRLDARRLHRKRSTGATRPKPVTPS